jgi:hypothetical protein
MLDATAASTADIAPISSVSFNIFGKRPQWGAMYFNIFELVLPDNASISLERGQQG